MTATEGGVARRRPKELSVAKPITLESEPLPQKERSRGVTVSSVLGGWEETAHERREEKLRAHNKIR